MTSNYYDLYNTNKFFEENSINGNIGEDVFYFM